MATPARRLILQNLATTLAGITTGNGYKTTVTTVETVAKSYADTVPSEKPWIGIYPQREALAYEHSGSIRVTLTSLLICHIAGSTVDGRASTLNDLLDDVIGVLGVDTTRGGNAAMTKLVSVETDEGDPDAYGHGSMVITSEVVYFRTDASS